MVRLALIVPAVSLLLAAPVAAAPRLGLGSVPAPVLSKPAPPPPEESNTSPYPTNYLEDVAQQLGVKNGRMDVFTLHPAQDHDRLMPSLSGSLGGEGAMIKLKWKS